MGKATELDDWHKNHPREPESSYPELRLRRDALPQIGGSRLVGEAIEAIGTAEGHGVELVDEGSGKSGILISPERYVELLGHALAEGPKEAHLDGRIQPAGLDDSDVEQVDPTATWVPVAGYDPRPAEDQ